jgi:2-isopropylmalate synthase
MVNVAGEVEHTASCGKGPVNALDKALRKALEKFYPQLRGMHLTDYKVRILDERQGTEAVTRVLVESADDDVRWGTVGVSSNIIDTGTSLKPGPGMPCFLKPLAGGY